MNVAPDHSIHFDDKIWFHIFAYFGNDFGLLRRTNTKAFRPANLFKAVGTLSKEFRSILLRYMQLVPHNYSYQYRAYYRKNIPSLLSWFCRYGVKLGSIEMYGQIQSDLELALFLWILKCCNTDQLEYLKVNFSWPSFNATRSIEITKDVEKFTLLPDGIRGVSSTADQLLVTDFLAEHASTVRRLHVSVNSDELLLPFFANKNRKRRPCLEELTLILRPEEGNNDDLQTMFDEVATFDSLKKLTLVVGSEKFTRRGGYMTPHRIESSTLEEIDVRESVDGFIFDVCNCPSLKVFRGKYIPRRHWTDGWVGVCAVSKITSSEIKGRIQRGEFCSFDDDFYGAHTLEYVAGSRPFRGMNVPDACIILIDALTYE